MVGFVSYRRSGGGVDPAAVQAIIDAEKGQANGLAELDGDGKIPSSQLTVTAMQYLGSWSANTNTPTLADGVGNTGDVYTVSAAGSVNFGSGAIDFAINDKIIYNGTTWEKIDTSDAVQSVNGQTGAVVLDTGDLADFAEAVQDVVGTAFVDSSTIDFTYNDGLGQVSAAVLANSLTAGFLSATAQYRLFGRSSAGAGAGQEIASSAAVFTMLGSANNAAILSNIGALALTGGALTGDLTITSTTGSPFTTSYSDDTAASGFWVVNRLSATPAAADNIWTLRFRANDSGGNITAYADMRTYIVDPTDGSEDGGISFHTISGGGSLTERLKIEQGLYISTATGGDKGVGTINFPEIYENNVRVAKLADNSLSLARLVNASAQYNIIMRTSAGSGSWQEKATSALIDTILGRTTGAQIIADIGAAALAGAAFTGAVTITTSTSTPLALQVNDDTATGGLTTFRTNSASPAALDNIWTWSFQGNDSGGNNTAYCAMGAVMIDPTDGSEDGRWFFQTRVGGSVPTARLRIDAGLYHPSATGGDKGDNTINFGSIYDDNVLLCAPLNPEMTQEDWDAIVVKGREEEVEREVVRLREKNDLGSKVLKTITLGAYKPPVEEVVVKEKVFQRVDETGKGKHITAKRHFRMLDQGFVPGDVDSFVAWMDNTRSVPALPTLDEWKERMIDNGVVDKFSIGERVERQMLAMDYMALAIKDLRDRNSALQERVQAFEMRCAAFEARCASYEARMTAMEKKL